MSDEKPHPPGGWDPAYEGTPCCSCGVKTDCLECYDPGIHQHLDDKKFYCDECCQDMMDPPWVAMDVRRD